MCSFWRNSFPYSLFTVMGTSCLLLTNTCSMIGVKRWLDRLPGPLHATDAELTNTSVCQHLGETFDKRKDPFSNSESFRKGEKTTLASDWLTICTERQSVKLAGMTPNCSHFSHLG